MEKEIICNIKKCSKCGINKNRDEFYNKKDSKDCLATHCKVCKKENDNKYYTNNREKIIERTKNYLEFNKENVKQSKIKRKDKIVVTRKKYYEKNIEGIVKYNKEYFLNNKEILSEKHIEYMKTYLLTKEYKESKRREYLKNKENNKHILIWRNTLNCTLSRFNKEKEGKTHDLLGYSAIELKEHIPSLFTDGMSWDNYGEWHVDHVIPVSSFNPSTPMNVVNALSNLRPLWATTRKINGVIYEGNLNRPKKINYGNAKRV